MKTFIYILRCPKSGEIRYVGKSNDPKKRVYAHARKDKTASTHKINWIQSLKRDGLQPKLEIIEEVDVQEWKEREKYWIKYYKENGAKLTNYCAGGEGLSFGNQTSFKKGNVSHNKGTGKPFSKTCPICNKIFNLCKSQLEKYTCCSIECREKRKAQVPNDGWFSKDSKPWNTGKKYRNPKSSNCVTVVQLDKGTLEFIKEYPSAVEASEQTGVSADCISMNVSGKSKSAGGFVWVRKRDYKKIKHEK